MGASGVGRDQRSSLLLERGKSAEGREPFICPKTSPEKERSTSSRKKFFNWMRRLSGKKEKQVDKQVAGGSPGKGSEASEVCDTCQEVSEEQKSLSSQLSGSYETKTGWGGDWRGGETRWGGRRSEVGEPSVKQGDAGRVGSD